MCRTDGALRHGGAGTPVAGSSGDGEGSASARGGAGAGDVFQHDGACGDHMELRTQDRLIV